VNTEDPLIVQQLEENGMMFVGHSTDNKRMEIMELKGRPNVVISSYCLICCLLRHGCWIIRHDSCRLLIITLVQLPHFIIKEIARVNKL